MKHKFLIGTVIVVVAIGILAACTQTADSPSQETQAVEPGDVETPVDEPETEETEATVKSEAELLIDERCSQCHSASRVYAENYTQEEWSDVFDDMIAKGADVTEEEKSLMIDWLVNRN